MTHTHNHIWPRNSIHDRGYRRTVHTSTIR